MINLKSGVSAAATAALLAMAMTTATPAVSAEGASKLVHCYGINSCKGSSDCKAGAHECKGQNSCKGQGFKAMTAAACTTAGGSLTEKK